MHSINPHMYGRAMITHLDMVIYTYENGYLHNVSLSVAPPFGNQSIALQKYGSLHFQNSLVAVPTHINMVTCMATIFPSAAPTGKPEYYIMKLWLPSCLSKLGTWGTVCAYLTLPHCAAGLIL